MNTCYKYHITDTFRKSFTAYGCSHKEIVENNQKMLLIMDKNGEETSSYSHVALFTREASENPPTTFFNNEDRYPDEEV